MVKNEIYGTRPKFLEPYLEKIKGIFLFKNIWFVTCINRINPDVRTRYLMVKECFTRNELDSTDMSVLRPFFKNYIKMWAVHIDADEAYYRNEGTAIKLLTLSELKEELLCVTKCKYLSGRGVTSEEASPFSQFFRSMMGSGFSFIDIDFIIYNQKNKERRLTVLEEKGFVDSQHNTGLIGYGQYLSFLEIYQDALNSQRLEDNIRWYIVFRDGDVLYLYDVFSRGFPKRSTQYYHRWRKMTEIPLSETQQISLSELIQRIVD